MILYQAVGRTFRRHLKGLYRPSRVFLDGGKVLAHPYLGDLLHRMAAADAKDLFRERVASLVKDLHFNGDEGCKNLVHVSFFENMDNLTYTEVARVREALSPRMNRAMDQAFLELGYPLR